MRAWPVVACVALFACTKTDPLQLLPPAPLATTPAWTWSPSFEVDPLLEEHSQLERAWFGSADISQWDFRPVILLDPKEGSPRVVEPDLYNHTWVHAAVSEDGMHWWGIADFAVEGPGQTLEIVSSHDGGATWAHQVSLSKPNFWALFESFHMGADGHGELTVRFESGAEPSVLQSARRALRPEHNLAETGRYTYTTKDWGRSWKGPRYQSATEYAGHEPYDPPDLPELMATPTATPTP